MPAPDLPREIYIEPTNRCNSRCGACVRTFRRPEPLRDLTLAEFESIIAQFPRIERLVLHGIGEPLLNPALPDMIRLVKQRQPGSRVLFNSNAILLDSGWRSALFESGLDEYRVSIDAATRETYLRVRGVDAFERVLDNLRSLHRERGARFEARVSLWLTANRENFRELPDLVNLAAELGVLEVYVQRLVFTDAGLAVPDQSLYRRIRAEEEAVLAEATGRAESLGISLRASGLTTPRGSLHGERRGRDCRRPWTLTYITTNGNVLPCCISPFSTHDYPTLPLGNVFRNSFPEIWGGPEYERLRQGLQNEATPRHPCEFCGNEWSL